MSIDSVSGASDLRGDWQSGTYYADGRAKPSLYWYRRPISVMGSASRSFMYVW